MAGSSLPPANPSALGLHMTTKQLAGLLMWLGEQQESWRGHGYSGRGSQGSGVEKIHPMARTLTLRLNFGSTPTPKNPTVGCTNCFVACASSSTRTVLP